MSVLLDPCYAEGLRRLVESGNQILDTHEYGGQLNPLKSPDTGAAPDDSGTTHLSVVDGEGNAVALTSTLNTEFGSGVISPSTGIILNNQMDDFGRPDTPNSYGLQPSEANYIAGGKWPLSSMSPTIVLQGGQLRMVAGGSGGPRILSSMLQSLVRVLLRNETVMDAVSNPRLHHQLLPNILKYEDYDLSSKLSLQVPNATMDYLVSKGNVIEPFAYSSGTRGGVGVNQVISVDPVTGTRMGVSDVRKGGSPAATKAKQVPDPSQPLGRKVLGSQRQGRP